MKRSEAEQLYQEFEEAKHDAFSKHEVWLKIFWDVEHPRKFDDDETDLE